MLYLTRPSHFNSKFEVVSCFIEYDGKILLLLRQDHKNEPNTYWVPAWKVIPWEKKDKAILREIAEESGLQVDHVHYFTTVYVQFPTYEFVYHIYRKKINEQPYIVINPKEHKEYIWRTPSEALKENLIQELGTCIKIFYGE